MTKAFNYYLIGSLTMILLCYVVKILVYKYFHPNVESMIYFFYYVGVHMLAALGLWYLVKDIMNEKFEKHIPKKIKVEASQVLEKINASNI
jgi:hypothetical protein